MNLSHLTRTEKAMGASIVALILALGLISWYGYTRITTLAEQVDYIDSQFASTTIALKTNISDATTSLGNQLQQEKQNVREQLGGVRDEVGSITGTVTDLQKLSKTDPQLLAKYSKIFFLSDNYAPARLVELPAEYKYIEKSPVQVIPEILPRLEAMIDAAKADNIALYTQSGYRSFDTQQALKGKYSVTYGAGTANQFSADQGYSEHQLGTALDFITTGTKGQLDGFDKTPAYVWLTANAYKYGFILSYPPNNSFYVFEPWHWRFVGVKLATDLHNKGAYFYTMDQRTIDTYLINLFD